jgi:prophage antirepressor-like protein
MENEKLLIFENPEFGQVRTIFVDGDPWFVAADVCRALEMDRTQIRRLDDDEKGVCSIHTLGGNQGTSIVSESGLYSLVLGSRKPEAKAFKRWITHEVIPSIRKHGAYVTDEVLNQMDKHPEWIPEYIQKLRDENANARAVREALEKAQAENALLAPKAGYYDHFVSDEDLLEKNYVFRDRHRDGRVFAKASKRNDPLFMTRDFYLPGGEKSEYTLVTPAGKAHFRARVDKIRSWEPGLAAGEVITEQAVFADDPGKPEEPR